MNKSLSFLRFFIIFILMGITTFAQKPKVQPVDLVYPLIDAANSRWFFFNSAGYEHKTFKGGGIEDYIEKGYIPHPLSKIKYGFHQDG